MTREELIVSIKNCMGIDPASTDFPEVDNVWIPAAMSKVYGDLPDDTPLKEDALTIACIALVANDMWNMQSGAVEFSPAVSMIMDSLQVRSLPEVMGNGIVSTH